MSNHVKFVRICALLFLLFLCIASSSFAGEMYGVVFQGPLLKDRSCPVSVEFERRTDQVSRPTACRTRRGTIHSAKANGDSFPQMPATKMSSSGLMRRSPLICRFRRNSRSSSFHNCSHDRRNDFVSGVCNIDLT